MLIFYIHPSVKKEKKKLETKQDTLKIPQINGQGFTRAWWLHANTYH